MTASNHKHASFARVRFDRSEHDDNLQAFLIAQDALGFLEEEQWWEVYFPAARWSEVERGLRDMCSRSNTPAVYHFEEFQEENWNEQWENSITPIQVSEHILITPSWHQLPDNFDGLTLIIDPKMSFGTGYHATTRLMLRLLEHHVLRNDRVFDVGTGTGVLAIAAIKYGASEATGVDIDEWSYDNANENAVRNHTEKQTRFFHGSMEHASGTYDLILSNITKLDNMDMMQEFEGLLNPGGRMILSGFYSDDVPEVLAVANQLGLTKREEIQEDEWSALLLYRENA